MIEKLCYNLDEGFVWGFLCTPESDTELFYGVSDLSGMSRLVVKIRQAKAEQHLLTAEISDDIVSQSSLLNV